MEVFDSLKSNSFIAVLGYDRDITYTLQSTNVGSISLTPAEMPARFSNIPFPGDKIEFGDLVLQYLLDDDMSQWVKVNEWMFGLAEGSFVEEETDISYVEITVLDRNNNPTVRITYHNAHPVSIGDIEMSVVDDETVLVNSASFVYTHYTIENVKTGKQIEYGRPKS